MAFVIPVFIWRNKFRTVQNPHTEIFVLVIATALFTGLSVYSYRHLPLMDFSAWRVGDRLDQSATSLSEFYVTYKNRLTGETREFLAPNYPWNDSVWLSNWIFVSQRVAETGADDLALLIEDEEGTDVTRAFVSLPAIHFILVSPSLEVADTEAFRRILPFSAKAQDEGYSFICITGSLAADARTFKMKHGVDMEFYNADDVILKAMIRSNPGLIMLNDGRIAAKWHYNDFPSWEEIKTRIMDDGN
jgi:hypothetical protein